MTIRVDKWLWATRFFKTRGLAKKAVEGGKVKLFGQKIKPSRNINIEDELEIKKLELTWQIKVIQLIDKRVSAKLAILAYDEREASVVAREELIMENKINYQSTPKPAKHPNKKDRRTLIKVKKNQL
jgi:ribosome-associated heat shock protein Hsp15